MTIGGGVGVLPRTEAPVEFCLTVFRPPLLAELAVGLRVTFAPRLKVISDDGVHGSRSGSGMLGIVLILRTGLPRTITCS